MTPYIPSYLSASKSPLDQDDFVSLLQGFLDDHEYLSGPNPPPCETNPKLEAAMSCRIVEKGLPLRLKKIIHVSASIAELCYPSCTFAERENIALFTMYLIYIDDACLKGNVGAFIGFEEHFLRRLPQPDLALDDFATVLLKMFDLYPIFFANGILNAAFQFVCGTCVEQEMGEQQNPNPSPRFPWFLRQQTGCSIAYALMAYPKTQELDYTICFQALTDMDFWICATNDLFSFYKEVLDGETANYISIRARAESQTTRKVASDLVQELATTRGNISSVFKAASSGHGAKVWRDVEYGYIMWHLTQDRYRLKDLGF